jgi:predicted metal-dependent HD superfamily phosphohydrolase
VREEHAHLADEVFRPGRAAILRAFAARERLYVSDHAHRAWTARARANLAAEIADLESASG